MARVQQGQVALEVPDSEVAYMASLGWAEFDPTAHTVEEVDPTAHTVEEVDPTAHTVEEFDPTAHTVEEVEVYLAGELPEEERERVLAAEANGKARKSILGKEGDVI